MQIKFVILCGGSGTRLWPVSRKNLPKQFIPIYNDKSLFELTLERILFFGKTVETIIVCNKQQSFIVKKFTEKLSLNAKIILEPERKNTTAAIYLAAKICEPDDVLIIMPSDHLIKNSQRFYKDIKTIIGLSDFQNWITLGIKPTKPTDAYGYIKVEEVKKNKLTKVVSFKEKPSKKKANEYLQNKNYYWNSGIFIVRADVAIQSVKNHSKNISEACDDVLSFIKNINNSNEINFSEELFEKIPSKSIDFGVLEFEKNIEMFPYNSDWSDVGSWDSVASLNQKDVPNNRVVSISSSNNYIQNDKRLIATVGVKNLIIVDNDDSLLIVKKNKTEKVKELVDELVKKNLVEAEEHSFEDRPWGKFFNLYISEYCKVKKIIVFPQKRLSLQYHNLRSEHWLIVSGTATVYLDGEVFKLNKGMSIDIPKKSQHYIHNETKKELIVIETQLGTYFGEDDIIRLDDPYLR